MAERARATSWALGYDPPGRSAGVAGPTPTPAERRVLELVALGVPTREIARRLWVSSQTVTYHIANLFMKCGADNRAGLVAREYSAGLLEPQTWPPPDEAWPRASCSGRARLERELEDQLVAA